MSYIGITGFTTVQQIEETLKTIDSGRKYMFGYLLSQKNLDGITLKNKRYTDLKTFKEMLKIKAPNIIRTIHFNAQSAGFAKELINCNFDFDAIQFNLSFLAPDDIRTLKETYPNIDLIFQLNKTISKKYSVEEIQNYLNEFNFKYFLYDMSGGTGRSFNIEDAINESKKYSGVKIVLAGGLNHENAKDIYNLGYGVDSESKLRDVIGEGYGNDIWNQEKVNKYILSFN